MLSQAELLFQAVEDDLQFILEGLPSNATPLGYQAFCARQLLNGLLKKYLGDSPDSSADDTALELFLDNNKRIGSLNSSGLPLKEEYRYLYDEIRYELERFFKEPNGSLVSPPVLDVVSILENGSWGPGSNLGTRRTDFHGKVGMSLMTYTNRYWYIAFNAYTSQVSPTWRSARKFADAFYGATQVDSNRLSFVPKKRDCSRTICTEPLLNMYIQKGIGSLISDRLASYYQIDIRYQPTLNRELARIGSEANRYGTIDLSMASDSISLRLIDEFLPRNVAEILKSIRSANTTLPDKRVVPLHMLSTMGNGYTFPLQTTIFAAVVRCCYRWLGIKPANHIVRPGNYAVFGDDIIVLKEVYDLVVDVLESLGFIVNTDKSYNIGPFRESCGADWFRGQPCRPVSLKKLDDAHDFDIAFNRIVEWCTQTGILLPKSLAFLYARSTKVPIPLWAPIDGGLRIPYQLRRCGLFKNTVRYDRNVQSPNFYYYRMKSGTMRFDTSSPYDNPNAWLLAAMHGDLRGVQWRRLRSGSVSTVGDLPVRSNKARYIRSLGYGAGWDMPNCGEPLAHYELWWISTIIESIAW